MKFLRKNKAFTLLETTIAITILVILFTLVSKTFLQFMKTYQYFLVRNEVYDETHFLFEEMIKKMRNSNIDYQSYWRENTRIKTSWDIRVVDQWSSQWANPQWASANLSSWWNFNSIKNCDNNLEDYNLTWTWRFIMENYMYQFTFPWIQEQDFWWWSYLYNFLTDNKVHLNCKTDSTSSSGSTISLNKTNLYDDDESYWFWPKAFSWSSLDWKWTWDYLDFWVQNNNPPLLLTWWKWLKRLAFRHWVWTSANLCNNWTWCILMIESEAIWFDKNWIPNKWKCLDDYDCPATFSEMLAPWVNWKDITPSKVIVTDFDFDIWPEKEPRYSFNQLEYNLPSYFTIKLKTKSLPWALNFIYTEKWIGLDLQTTIIPRNNTLIKTLN